MKSSDSVLLQYTIWFKGSRSRLQKKMRKSGGAINFSLSMYLRKLPDILFPECSNIDRSQANRSPFPATKISF
jgi:hypothetical protein